MKLRTRALVVQILAVGLCLCVPWPGFSAEIAPAIVSAGGASTAFDPLFHQELQLSFDRLFPQDGALGARSLQALRVMQAEYAAAARSEKPEPAAQARAEAAAFIAGALEADPVVLAKKLEAAGVPDAVAARILSVSDAVRRRASSDGVLARALRQVSEPIPVSRLSRLARARRMVAGAVSQWRAPQPALVLAANSGMPIMEALRADQALRQMRSAVDWPAAQRLRPFSGGGEWVPTSKKVAQLQKLSKTDSEAAFAQASAVLADQAETRLEVRASAFRLVAEQPAARAFPALLKVLNEEPSWYLKRMAARWFGVHAAELGEGKADAEKALRQSYRNSNSSVRVMSRWALERMGVDAGPESVPVKISVVPWRPSVSSSPRSSGDAPAPVSTPMKIARAVLIFGAVLVLWAMMTGSPKKPASARPPTPAELTQTQTIAAPDKAQPLSPDQQILKDINDNLRQIKEATQKQADATQTQTNLMVKNEREKEEAKAKASQPGAILMSVFGSLLMMLLPLGLLFWLIMRMQSRGASGILGKTNITIEHPNVRFSDVAGVDDALRDVAEITDYLDNPGKFKKLGVRPPKGILLEGPPGTGKTLMARAVAGEANAAFLSMKGSDFIQLYVGVGATRVRELFDEARKNQPAIVFIDEIDAIGASRGDGPSSGGHSEHRQTLIALLAELDGFMKMDNVIVIAATNRAQDLDEALTRPGRFDRKIFVGNPDVLGREAILAVHGAKVRLGPDADVEFTAKRTPGLSGAAMANIINESGLQAGRDGADSISQKNLQRAVSKETFGDERNLFLDDKTKKRVAEHEAGHALAQFYAMLRRGFADAKVDNKITIIPHGKAALGYAESAQRGEADTYLQTQDELEAGIVGAMGGRAAEETIYPGKKGISTGPGSDIADHADRIARIMVEQLGMSEKVGIINAAPNPRDPLGRSKVSEATKYEIDQEIQRITKAALDEAKQLIAQNRGRYDALVKALLEQETLYQEQIREILAGPSAAAPSSPAPAP